MKSKVFLTSLILIISTMANLYLTSNSLLNLSALLLAISSLVIALTNFSTYLDPTQKSKWDAANNNAREAQRMIQERSFGIFKYASWKQVYGHDDIPTNSIREMIEAPLIWILCIILYAMFFLTPAYLDFSFNNLKGIMKLILFSFMQILFLSAAFSGMLLVINRKLRGDQK